MANRGNQEAVARAASEPIPQRMSARAVRRLLDKTASADLATRRRINILFELLTDAEKAQLDQHSTPHASPNRSKLQQYVEANAELFGLFAYRSALKLVLGEDVSDKLLRRLYEPDDSE